MANPQEFNTIIGADAIVKGEIQLESPAKILGRVEGTITGKASVLVAEGADCKAAVTAKEVAVQGRIEGDVTAEGRIDLQNGGIVVGDITAARMTMTEGASVNGHLRIGPAAEGKAKASAETKPEARPHVHVSAGQAQPQKK